MSRIRTIKPEWRTDQKLARAGLEARVLSVALITLADDEGRGVWREPVMAADVFGYDANPSRHLRDAVANLSGWFVEVYRVRGEDYFQILNWSNHQKVDKAKPSRIPPMEEREDASEPEPGKPTETAIRDSVARESRQPRDGVATESARPRDTVAPGPRTLDHGPGTRDLEHMSADAAAPADPEAASLEPPSRGKPRRDPGEVRAVFEHWRQATGKTHAAKLDGKRKRRIEWALGAYGLGAVKRCIDGYAASAWHRGDNDRGRPYDDLALWLRDAEHVERGIEMAEAGPGVMRRGALPPADISAEEAEQSRAAFDAIVPQLPGAANG